MSAQMDPDAFAQLSRCLRQFTGTTQREFAAICGVRCETIQRLERGEAMGATTLARVILYSFCYYADRVAQEENGTRVLTIHRLATDFTRALIGSNGPGAVDGRIRRQVE